MANSMAAAVAAGNNNGRSVRGTGGFSARNASGDPSPNTKRVAKKNGKSDAPNSRTGHRSQINADRLGPAFRVQASLGSPTAEPSASKNLANSKILTPTIHRSEAFVSARQD